MLALTHAHVSVVLCASKLSFFSILGHRCLSSASVMFTEAQEGIM